MLPFLKHLQDGASGNPSEPIKREPDAEYDSLESAAEDLMNAVHAKDIKGIASALRSAFELVDSQPHVEGPHKE